MKKLLVTVCGAAMINLATLSQAQDSTSTDYNNQNTVEQQSQNQSAQDQSQPTQDQSTHDQPVQDQPVQDGNNAIRQGQSRETGQPTEDQIDQTMERPNEMVPVEGKEGPNGEPVFRENGKYFYMNEAGKKKKIKESELRDKTQ
jgi:hypothetical protein